MTSAQRTWLLKERLDRYGEKLGGISGSVRIEQRRYPALIGSAQRRKLVSHNFAPGQLLFVRCQSRHPIGCVIFVVELVSKFMKDNILTIGRISRAVFDGAPGQDQRTHSTASLAKTTHSPLFPNMLTNLPFFFHHVCQWINKNREETGEIVRPAMQQQKTSLRRDSHADLIRDPETATSFETFFGKKYLNVTKQFRAVARGQFMKKYDMTLNQRQPFFRKRPRSQATSPPLLQELKDHMKMLTKRFTTFASVGALRY